MSTYVFSVVANESEIRIPMLSDGLLYFLIWSRSSFRSETVIWRKSGPDGRV